MQMRKIHLFILSFTTHTNHSYLLCKEGWQSWAVDTGTAHCTVISWISVLHVSKTSKYLDERQQCSFLSPTTLDSRVQLRPRLSTWPVLPSAERCRGSTKVTRYTNIRSTTSCTLWVCMHNATNNSHQTENRQRNGTLLVGVFYSVDMITMIFLFFFLRLLSGRKRKTKCRTALSQVMSQFWRQKVE